MTSASAEADALAWARARANRSRTATVDLIRIATELDATVVKRRSRSPNVPHGSLTRTNSGNWRIVVPVSETFAGQLSRRDRFTVAHEIAHILLYERGVPRPANKRDYWNLETVCNRIGGALLVPNWIVPEQALRPSDGFRHVRAIQRMCKVSYSVAATEVMNAENNVVGAATIRLEDNGRAYYPFAVGVFPERGSRVRNSQLVNWAKAAATGSGSIAHGDVLLGEKIVHVCLHGKSAPESTTYVNVLALSESEPDHWQKLPECRTQSEPAAQHQSGAAEFGDGRVDQLTLFR